MQDYQALVNRAREIENKFKSMLDTPTHAVSLLLRQEFLNLISDIRTSKHPRTVENRLLKIQKYLIASRNQSPIMRIEEYVELDQICDRFRFDIRRLPNYQ